MKRIILLIATIGLMQSVSAQTTYTGSFYAPDGMGMHTDQYFNLTPNSGANSTNYWNVYHKDGGSILLAHYGAAQPYVQVGSGRWTNFIVNGMTGIGTSTPAYALDVFGSGARVKNTSTATASYTTLRLQGPDYTNGLEMDFFGNNNISTDLNWSYGGGVGSASIINVNAKPLTFGTSNLGRMIIDATGNVGIGTFSPNQKLTVNGTIYGKEVKVDLSVPGPDYVFEKNYNLPSLESVQFFINQNKHLPEVPSAREMEANGINLSEMNMLLLKKVEELTLYVIELKKENEGQNQILLKQSSQIESLKQK